MLTPDFRFRLRALGLLLALLLLVAAAAFAGAATGRLLDLHRIPDDTPATIGDTHP